MTAWAKPADLLIAYKYANASEWRRHIEWFKDNGYPWHAQLRKEADKVLAGRTGGVGALGGASRGAEPEGEIQTMGAQVLAGGY